jgi:hypothetical protein
MSDHEDRQLGAQWMRPAISSSRPPAVGAIDQQQFGEWLAGVPAQYRPAVKATTWPGLDLELAPQWHLVFEPQTGDWPHQETFDAPEQLALRIRELDGQDTLAFAFYGVAVPFATGPWRYLFLPDGRVLYADDAQEVQNITMDEVHPRAAVQEDHYLGKSENQIGIPPERAAGLRGKTRSDTPGKLRTSAKTRPPKNNPIPPFRQGS